MISGLLYRTRENDDDTAVYDSFNKRCLLK